MRTPTSSSPVVNSRLGRAIRLGMGSQRVRRIQDEHERQKQGNWLRDVILGGQDGLVNVLGIALGISAATSNVQVLIAACLAATFTESISMGAVAYTSTLTERDHYHAMLEIEQTHISQDPDVERGEVRKLYADKGFQGELLDKVVETITANRDAWVDTLLSDELHLEPVETRAVLRTSVIVTIACLIGSFLPLIPYILFGRISPAPAIAAVIVSGIALVGVGVGVGVGV